MGPVTSRNRTALFAMAVLMLCLWKPWLRWLVPAITCVLGYFAAREFHRMARHAELSGSFFFCAVATVALVACGTAPLEIFSRVTLAVMLILLMGSFVVYMAVHGFRDAIHGVPAMFFGPVYIGLPLALTLQVLQADRMFLIFGLAMIWLADSGAYFFGRKYGQHKLAPTLSPKKTVEGALGGIGASILMGLLFKAMVPVIAFEYTWLDVVILGAITGVVAPAGDLAESVLKRDSGVKDSGRSMGGHGGVLDRLDSMLFCFCAYYIFLMIDGKL